MKDRTMCSASTGGCYQSRDSDANQCKDCDVFNGMYATDIKDSVVTCTAYSSVYKTLSLIFVCLVGFALI